MGYPSNHLIFSDNIFEPTKINVSDEKYMMYKARYRNLYDLYEYLKANPEVNSTVFRQLASLRGDSHFAGKPYPEAVEDLVSVVDAGYKEFLELQNSVNSAKKMPIHKYKLVRTVAGGHLNIPAYSAGAPLCYETEERVIKPRFIRVHLTLSYYWGTSKSQVFNRAIIITNIVKALEQAGYSVDINAFEMSACCDELAYIIVEIKKHGGRINMSTLYKTLCHVEFLRRILFRILETLDVRRNWNDGYGRTCSEGFVRKALKFGKDDIFFDQPRDMGIRGDDLAEDFEKAVEHLNLDDKIDVEKAKNDFNDGTHILVKKR